jgi:uncharacterized protein YkwD
MRTELVLALVAVTLSFSLGGCAADSGSEGTATPMTSDGSDGGGPMMDDPVLPMIDPPECADVVLPSVFPATVTGETNTADDTLDPAPCVMDGTTGSNDLIAFFVAPKTGDFLFSTVGSNFDTVMHARAGDCSGAVIDCNDDAVGKASELVLSLNAGDTVVLVIDGFNRETGEVSLTVEGREQACDDGLDGDNDGVTDCEDTDCFLSCEDPAEWPADWATFEEEVLVETNRARAAGATCDQDVFPPIGPLEMNQFLRYSSRLHARDMGVNNYFEHESQDGRSPGDRMRQVGFEGAFPTGENIAAGQKTPADVVESWMNSPGHCRNIMDADYHVMGVGFALIDGSSFGEYWVQNFGGGH